MTSHPHPTAPPRGALVSLALLLLLVLVACSGGAGAQPDDVATLNDPSASPTGSAAPSMDPEEAMQAFASCMREHGVNLQVTSAGKGQVSGGDKVVSGTSSGPRTGAGTDKGRADFEAANKACAHFLPQGGVNGAPGKMDPEMEQKLLDFSRCMREHGVNMPDPKFENGGATVELGGPNDEGPGLDPQSKTFQDAQKACESLLPSLEGGDGAPTTQAVKP